MKAAFATGPNGEFASGSKLPWDKPIKEDMKHFASFCKDETLIMGYNTWQSLPSQVQEKYNDGIVVFSRKDDNYYNFNNTRRMFCANNEEFLSFLEVLSSFELADPSASYCVIGGAEYIKASIDVSSPVTNVLYTKVTPADDTSLEADKRIPTRYVSSMLSRFNTAETFEYETGDYNVTVTYNNRPVLEDESGDSEDVQGF